MRSKQVLYNTMTWDPETSSSASFVPNYRKHLYAASPSPLAAPSPPFSPSTMSRASSSGYLAAASAAAAAQLPAFTALAAAAAAATAGGGKDAAAAAAAPGAGEEPQQVAVASAAAVAAGGAKEAPKAAAADLVRKDIPHMPDAPLSHLRRLNELMQQLVEQVGGGGQGVFCCKREINPTHKQSHVQPATLSDECVSPCLPTPSSHCVHTNPVLPPYQHL